ncbi:PAAR domain-containing protein [Duganella vulcania]|uniref:PAAR domain-containing protein n=1 Tax=Duganella vulcania TaxID=2692166 RepID=A0A845GJ20_9BURK|nr:PAAR domain-containing protein [Duganella vulcania]MYM93395.1 PAAR domain-containing protein [Duganella vulcania]
MRKVIRLNDSTSHGGKVVRVAATHFTVGGIAVARVGDECTCPIKGHGKCVIIEGDPHHTIDGVAVAYEGHKTSCGATLVATVDNFGRA